MKKYRVVTDAYAGYEVQVKDCWILPYIQVNINTFQTVELAIEFINELKEKDARKAASGRVVHEE